VKRRYQRLGISARETAVVSRCTAFPLPTAPSMKTCRRVKGRSAAAQRNYTPQQLVCVVVLCLSNHVASAFTPLLPVGSYRTTPPATQQQPLVSLSLSSPVSSRTSRGTRTDENEDDDSSITTNGSKESPRLSKAKQLLEQLSKRDEDTAKTPNGGASAQLVSPAGRPRTADDMVVVPDTFWSNGHLADQPVGSSSNKFVTRWTRGVNVAEPLVQYDPVAAEKLLFRQPTKWLVRNFQIVTPLSLWALNVVTDYLLSATEGETARSARRRARAVQLTRAISSLGPAIIKAGQALSSRPDVLPSEYLDELQKLQDDVPRFSNQVAFKTVEDELEVESFFDVFDLVEEEPVAAASIGQVYKARLLANGDIVALKIQRPNCEEIIALDLYILRWWAGWYNKLFRLLNKDIDVRSIIDDFGTLIYREIDYLAEAANTQRFNELYAGVTDVFVPKVYSDFSTSKVLTMEWVDGFRLTDRENLIRYNLDAPRLVNTLVECSLRQILENGFFHADPHAGNLLATADGRLCYLDFGMMSYADVSQRNGFLLAVIHVVNRDWEALVRLYQRLGFIPEETDLRPIEEALERALPDVLNAEISELNIKNIFNKLGNIFYNYPFSLPPFYIAIIRCLGVLEGLALQVDPTARVISKAYPYVASRVLTDKQDELQEAFRQLVFTKDGGALRWDRLESLLDEAKDSSGYDVTAALSVLTDYFVSSEKVDEQTDARLSDLANQIVDAADTLGSESLQYVLEASRALAINDEVAAVRAFQSLQDLLQRQAPTSSNPRDLLSEVDGVRKKMGSNLRGALPAPSPSMVRSGRILSLVAGGNEGSAITSADPSKFVPIVRKLSQDPRVRKTAGEVLARLGERVLSRSLRAAFGLPPPDFRRTTSASTVTEDISR
jgi:predicted unusual protein kinase regulating ubiquinone biosynthesis (AarF/ABC1/UbiB family)